MTVWEYIVYTVFLCVAPAGVIWACRRFPLLGRLGPIMVLYAVGMVVGNMPFLPAGIATLQEIIPNVMIPLAIPMMLFGCSFSRGEARLQMKIIFSGFLSVCGGDDRLSLLWPIYRRGRRGWWYNYGNVHRRHAQCCCAASDI